MAVITYQCWDWSKTMLVKGAPGDIIWCHETQSSLVQVMAYHLTHSTYDVTRDQWVNTLGQKQNGRHFADNIFKCIFLNENFWILDEISLKYVPSGLNDNMVALVQTRTTRTPAFWGYPPPPHDYPHYWIPSQNKSSQRLPNTPICQHQWMPC